MAEAPANIKLIKQILFYHQVQLDCLQKKLMKSTNLYKTQSELLTKEILSM